MVSVLVKLDLEQVRIDEIFNMFRVMALPVMEFQVQGYKIRNIFSYESTYPEEISEFLELD